ncbi:MAG: SAM-dependent methyltransferase [Gaiellaceae bacterium]
MEDCRCGHLGSIFTPRMAAREAKRYREHGPGRASALLIGEILERGVDNAVVLDIGGGVGAIQHELLAGGAQRTVSVDAAPSYRDELVEEAARRGHEARVLTFDGDFVELAASIEAADIVTLDKVICCDPDAETLLEAAAGHATQLVGLVYPRETLLVRAGARMLNTGLWLFRRRFRWLVHPVARVDAVLAEAGFRPSFRRRGLRTMPWEIALYER